MAGRLVVAAEVEARDERPVGTHGVRDVAVCESVLHRKDDLVPGEERRDRSESSFGVQRFDGAQHRTEWCAELRWSQGGGGADGEVGEALERQSVRADRRKMGVGGLDERDVMPSTDEMSAGDATDGTRAEGTLIRSRFVIVWRGTKQLRQVETTRPGGGSETCGPTSPSDDPVLGGGGSYCSGGSGTAAPVTPSPELRKG